MAAAEWTDAGGRASAVTGRPAWRSGGGIPGKTDEVGAADKAAAVAPIAPIAELSRAAFYPIRRPADFRGRVQAS